jgi:hypothetical protein
MGTSFGPQRSSNGQGERILGAGWQGRYLAQRSKHQNLAVAGARVASPPVNTFEQRRPAPALAIPRHGWARVLVHNARATAKGDAWVLAGWGYSSAVQAPESGRCWRVASPPVNIFEQRRPAPALATPRHGWARALVRNARATAKGNAGAGWQGMHVSIASMQAPESGRCWRVASPPVNIFEQGRPAPALATPRQ